MMLKTEVHSYKFISSSFCFPQQHEKTTDERKRTYKDLEKTIRQKDNDNEQLLKELEDLNVSVYERRHIEDVNGRFK